MSSMAHRAFTFPGANVLDDTRSMMFGSNTICNSLSPPLIDIVYFDPLCMTHSNTSTKKIFSHTHKYSMRGGIVHALVMFYKSIVFNSKLYSTGWLVVE